VSEHVIRLPDVGEGVAQAELVEWHVRVGDLVREDTTLAAVMTDKATVEIPSPVEGEVTWLGAKVGDSVAVGSELIRLKVAGDAEAPKARSAERGAPPQIQAEPASSTAVTAKDARPPAPGGAEMQPLQERPPDQLRPGAATCALRPEAKKPLASPAVRLRAREAGIDLRLIHGTAPAGRVTHEDLDAFLARGPAGPTSRSQPRTAIEEIELVGLRRRVAEKMAVAHARIPHITYVEEVDVSALEDLRTALNAQKGAERPKLTPLSFILLALVRAVEEFPRFNATFDDEAGVLHRHAGVHIGVATQTRSGLLVPVLRHAETHDLWSCASELTRLAEAARSGRASRDELTGSTITVTSLGSVGGLVTTPIINHPEVAIVGVNKIVVRPIWSGTAFIPRKMMNLSSSFDHRVVDGWDAAMFVQRIKALVENPALIFLERAGG
jgi:2-oxoisovalerate dehydrogenase E2 component (dihydrolipoyl transacylase)